MINYINKDKKRNGFTLVELAIVILIIWLFSTFARPYDYHRPKPYEAIQKQCFSNQRILQGAIEMYNMDNSIKLDKAFPGFESDDAIRTLEENGYLKKFNESNKDICSYGFVDMSYSGRVFCVYHGTTKSKLDEEPIYPEIASGSEKPYYEDYNNLKNSMRVESQNLNSKISKELSRKIYFEDLLFCSPLIPGTLLAITIIAAIVTALLSSGKKEDSQS